MLQLCLALSSHVAFQGDYNQLHPCFRVQHQSFIVGGYINSEKRPSLYGGFEYTSTPFFAEVGIVSGYANAPILPWLRAGVEIESIRYFVAPGIEFYKNEVTLHPVFGVEITLWEN